MINRRSLLQISSAALVTPLAGFAVRPARAQDAALFKFGVVADPQYAPFPPKPGGTRYYANSLWKLDEAMKALNAEDLQFVSTLGDIIDRHWESYNDILPIYDQLSDEQFAWMETRRSENGRRTRDRARALSGLSGQ